MATGDRPNTAPKPGGKKTKKHSQKEQSERFKETARDLEIDENMTGPFEKAISILVPIKAN